jgi:hypothetical protein
VPWLNRREAGKSLAALPERAIVKRIAPIWIISSVLLVACGALCQSERASEGLLQGDGSNSLEAQLQEMRTWRSLPDAPSTVQPPTPTEKSQTFAYEARLPLAMGAATNTSNVRRGTELRHVTPVRQPSLIPSDELLFSQKESSNFVVKYLCPPLVKRSLLYHPSTSNTLIGRATYAASHIFVRRDDSGKRRLNASYFLGVLSLVAAHNARRPYWARSASAPFNDFGSTIGNDAGLNLFHEFEPGIRQMVKGYTPRFAFKVEERITRDQNLKEVVSSPAR